MRLVLRDLLAVSITRPITHEKQMEVIKNIHTLLMLLAYVMRRAGTFSMEEKVKMIEFLGYMAANPHARIAGPGGEETPLGRAMQYRPSPVGRLQAPSLVSRSLERIPHH